MSELYSVHVERVRGGEVSFRVTTVHPDAGPPPDAATFPMNLVIDLWGLLERGYTSLIEGCELGEEQAIELALDPAHAARLEELRRLAYGYKLPCTADDHKELERKMNAGEETDFHGHQVGGWGASNGECYVQIRGDAGAFARVLAPLVAGFGVDEQENSDCYENWPYDDDDRQLPRARVWIELKDPTLVAWVRPGWTFDSASYY